MRKLAVLTFFLSQICIAASPSVWVSDGAPALRVQVDPSTQGIDVTLNKGPDQTPESIGITFHHANGKKTALELKALAPRSEPGQDAKSPQARYAGTLSPAAQSFVGFEVRIPFSSKKPLVIRSEDLKRPN